MIYLKVLNASYVQCLKNADHYQILSKILQYNCTYKRKGQLRTDKASFLIYGKFGLGLLNYVTSKLRQQNIEYDIEWKKSPTKLPLKKEVKI